MGYRERARHYHQPLPADHRPGRARGQHGSQKPTPFTLGTMRDDTPTFGFLLLGTIMIIGALLFLPLAALGPMAEHLGPIPFGG